MLVAINRAFDLNVTLAEAADCDALRMRCPVCQKRVVLEAEVGAPSFRSKLTSSPPCLPRQPEI